MASEKFDYETMIADLKAKRATLDAAIASLEAARALGTLGQATEGAEVSKVVTSGIPGAENGYPVELPHGAFHGKSLPAAIKLYLSAVKKKRSIREIATALREHGMESTSDNFEGVVTGSLNRLKSLGEVLRFKDGWGLSEWYPEAFRSRITSEPKTRKGGKKKRSKKGKAAASTDAPRESLEDRIKAVLSRKPQPWSPKEMATELGATQLTGAVGLAFERMYQKGQTVKDTGGKYHPSIRRVSLVPESA
jgi:hypothetical protein